MKHTARASDEVQPKKKGRKKKIEKTTEEAEDGESGVEDKEIQGDED